MRKLTFSGCFQDAFLHLYFSCSSVICVVLGFLWFLLFVIQSISWMNIVFTLYTHNFNSFLWSLLKITKAWAPSQLSEGLLGLSLFICSIVFLWFGRISPAHCSVPLSPPHPSSLGQCLFPIPTVVTSVSLLEFPVFLLVSQQFTIVHEIKFMMNP